MAAASDTTQVAPAETPAEPAKRYVVTAEAAVVHVNTTYERYLYRGAVVPKSVGAKEIARLVDIGLIAEFDGVVVEPADEPQIDAE